MPTPHLGRANRIGGLWMIAAMAAFAVEDVLIKSAATRLPLGEITLLFGTGGALIFASLATLRGETLLNPAVLCRPMILRVLFEVSGRLFHFLAITLAPLSAATAILQATPLVVVAGAALFLGEKVGRARWAAIGAGMIGVLIILRPATDSFTATSLLAVFGMIGFAGRDLASRAAPRSLSLSLLGFYGFLALIVAGGFISLWQGQPFTTTTPQTLALITATTICGTLAYAALMQAMRTGEVSAVTPFRYTRLLFGLAAGAILFKETIDASTLAGCALIVASGLIILWTNRRAAQT